MKLGSKLKPAIPPMDAGTYLGICIGVIGLGEQESTYNKQTRYVNKIRFIFEIPDETIEVDGEQKPRQLSTDFTVARKSTSRIRQFINTWLSKTLSDAEYEDLEMFDFIGRNAMLSVVHSEDGQYANIASAAQLPKGFPKRKPVSPLLRFDADEWDYKAFEELPEYLQEKLKQSTQYRNKHLPEDEVSVEAASTAAAEDAQGEEAVPF
jgi:hypothetical protein